MFNRTRHLTIKNPCPKSWAEMKGSETRRFCTHCSKHVHHLSRMSRSEAALLLHLKKGNLCAVYECGNLGEVHYTPILTRVHALIRPVTVGLLSAMLGLLGIGCSSTHRSTTQVQPPQTPTVEPSSQPPKPSPDPRPIIMGDIAPQIDVCPPSTVPLMGKVAAPENPPKN